MNTVRFYMLLLCLFGLLFGVALLVSPFYGGPIEDGDAFVLSLLAPILGLILIIASGLLAVICGIVFVLKDATTTSSRLANHDAGATSVASTETTRSPIPEESKSR